jgi:hypothetical protein
MKAPHSEERKNELEKPGIESSWSKMSTMIISSKMVLIEERCNNVSGGGSRGALAKNSMFLDYFCEK